MSHALVVASPSRSELIGHPRLPGICAESGRLLLLSLRCTIVYPLPSTTGQLKEILMHEKHGITPTPGPKHLCEAIYEFSFMLTRICRGSKMIPVYTWRGLRGLLPRRTLALVSLCRLRFRKTQKNNPLMTSFGPAEWLSKYSSIGLNFSCLSFLKLLSCSVSLHCMEWTRILHGASHLLAVESIFVFLSVAGSQTSPQSFIGGICLQENLSSTTGPACVLMGVPKRRNCRVCGVMNLLNTFLNWSLRSIRIRKPGQGRVVALYQ